MNAIFFEVQQVHRHAEFVFSAISVVLLYTFIAVHKRDRSSTGAAKMKSKLYRPWVVRSDREK